MLVPKRAWRPAIHFDGSPRRGAQIAEFHGVTLAGMPTGRRASSCVVSNPPRRPAAPVGPRRLRHQVLLTNSAGNVRRLEVRQRRSAEVENRIPNLEDCGLERMPFTSFTSNAAWMEMVLAAADLLVWCQQRLLTQ